jgi:hypothetical protein
LTQRWVQICHGTLILAIPHAQYAHGMHLLISISKKAVFMFPTGLNTVLEPRPFFEGWLLGWQSPFNFVKAPS